MHIFQCACANLAHFYFPSEIWRHCSVPRPKFPTWCGNSGDLRTHEAEIGIFDVCVDFSGPFGPKWEFWGQNRGCTRRRGLAPVVSRLKWSTTKKAYELLFDLLVMADLCNRGAIIFLPCDFYLLSIYLSIFFSSPNLSGHRLDLYHTSTHGVALARI